MVFVDRLRTGSGRTGCVIIRGLGLDSAGIDGANFGVVYVATAGKRGTVIEGETTRSIERDENELVIGRV